MGYDSNYRNKYNRDMKYNYEDENTEDTDGYKRKDKYSSYTTKPHDTTYERKNIDQFQQSKHNYRNEYDLRNTFRSNYRYKTDDTLDYYDYNKHYTNKERHYDNEYRRISTNFPESNLRSGHLPTWRENYYDTGHRFSNMSDLDYISKSDNNTVRKYESYESYKRPRIDYKTEFSRSMHDNYNSRPYKTRHISAEPNNTLGLFGLHQSITEEDLKAVLEEKLIGLSGYSYKLIMDERSGLCKGFCFIDFLSLNDAISARKILGSESFRGQDFKCDYSYKHGIVGDFSGS